MSCHVFLCVGVILYWLLVGHPPFVPNCGADCGWRRGEDCHRCQLELCTKIQNGHVSFPASDWQSLSCGARDLVQKLLRRSPSERLSAAGVLEHDWVRKAGSLPPDHPFAYAYAYRIRANISPLVCMTYSLYDQQLLSSCSFLVQDRFLGLFFSLSLSYWVPAYSLFT